MGKDQLRVFCCGDVMVGRGVDQILPRPSDPTLWENRVADARTYVELAEETGGTIPRPVAYAWPWGEALTVLSDRAPDARVINLETAVTRSAEFAPAKSVHYRMNPDNITGVTVARPDVCVLANNHVQDFGRHGLVETLDTLAAAGLPAVGAGRNAAEVSQPGVVPLTENQRLLVFSWGSATSGIPSSWAASGDHPGVAFLERLSDDEAARVVDQVARLKQPGDVVLVSIHWGSNWGYEVPAEQVRFAHRLVDGGVDFVHGHSSHHPRPIEVYRDRLILYGCGDLIDDYEGIAGYERYRDDLRLLYVVDLDSDSGRLTGLEMVPMHARRMRLEHASPADSAWMRQTLDRISRPWGVGVTAGADGTLVLDVDPQH